MRAMICILALNLLGDDLNQPAADDHAETMMGFLKDHVIAAFMDEAKREGWKSPIIYSKWYVDKMEDTKAKDEAIAARELGRLLVGRISEVAAKLIPSMEREEWVKMSEELLSLAAWIGGTEGYGNLFLGARCHDVASVGVARLVVDLGVPFERIKPMMASFDAAWYGPEVRSRVLNAEAGVELFKVEGLPRERAQETLAETWHSGIIMLLKQQGTWKHTLPVQIPFGPVWENATFFEVTDSRYGPRCRTTETEWDVRLHERLAGGIQPVNVRNLRPLAAFREKVGAFPLERRSKGYSPWREPGMTAFEGAWRPYETRETLGLGLSAWDTFDALSKGGFIDEDTWNVRDFEMRKAVPTPCPGLTGADSQASIQ